MDFDQGTSALYGLNGAGKTSILRSTKDALCGTACATDTNYSDLHIKLHSEQEPIEGSFNSYLSNFLTTAISALYGEVLSPNSINEHGVYVGDDSRVANSGYFVGEDPGRRSDHLSLLKKLEKYIDLHSIKNELLGEHLDALLAISANGRLTLRSSGDETWSLWISISGLDGIKSRMHLGHILSVIQGLIAGSDKLPNNVEYEIDLTEEAKSTLDYVISLPSVASKDRLTINAESAMLIQIPIIKIGDNFTHPALRLIDDQNSATKLDQVSLEVLIKNVDDTGSIDFPDDARPEQKAFRRNIADKVLEVQGRASNFINLVLPEPPTLRFNLRTDHELFIGLRPQWEFANSAPIGPRWSPIKNLSSAQLRWSRSCITLALAEIDDLPVVFLCDEPESGLHRLAERKMAIGLGALPRESDVNIIAATHSAYILNSFAIRKSLVYRSAHRHAVRIRPLELGYSDDLELQINGMQIGLDFSDILQLMKVAVVVEGLHDQIVLKKLLRRNLDQAQASVLPMRGAKRLKSLAEARFIFMGTQAKILVVVDNVKNDELYPLWSNIIRAFARGDFESARRGAAELSTQGTDEAVYLGELASASLEIGNIERIEVHGLSAPDVICYLPESALFGTTQYSWQELTADWTSSSAGRPKNIKGYLKKRGLLPQSSTEIDHLVAQATDAAAEGIELLQPDVVELGNRIVEISQQKALGD
ncbi:hypothetical protein SRABI91_02629 [Rhodococcoides fascians]|nr:hypothetical protein SRABI91_02629 [Rhodococcus fascians]